MPGSAGVTPAPSSIALPGTSTTVCEACDLTDPHGRSSAMADRSTLGRVLVDLVGKAVRQAVQSRT